MSSTDVDRNKIVVWAKNRSDYVTPIKTVSWSMKDSSKFGRSLRGNLNGAGGDLFETNWSNLLKLRPNSLEVIQNPNPFENFVEKLRRDENCAKEFFKDLVYFGFNNEATLNVEDICSVIEFSEKLAIFEYSGVDSSDFEKILNSLRSKSFLRAINFQCPMTVAQIHQFTKELKLKIRLVRFCGFPGLDLSEFMKIRDEFPCVELLALQDFNFRIIDEENVEQIDPLKFFNKIYYVFPNLKMFYMDWRIIDVVCSYDDRTISFCSQIQKLYKNLKLQFVAILIYSPSVEMKQSVTKIQEYFQKENEIDQLKVRAYEFALNPDLKDHPNFSLIVFGEYHYQARTKRLIEIIVDGRETNLDLRHLCYIVDQDKLLNPDVTVEFGGFDSNEVLEKYHQSKTDEILADAAVDRCFTGSSG